MRDERETIQRNPESVTAWKRECAFLREQVEKLTQERNAFQDQCIRLKNERAVEKGQLATLAERFGRIGRHDVEQDLRDGRREGCRGGTDDCGVVVMANAAVTGLPRTGD